MRTLIQMECGQCKRRNYATSKNKTTMTGKFELKKFCRWCRKHTVHKEAK